MGRGAAVSGNGRVVLPPAALTPVTRYRQPPRRRGALQVVGRILLWTCAAVLMLVASLAGGAYLFFHESVAAVSAHSRDLELAQKQLDVALPGQPAVALVVGYDHRASDGRGVQSRSDTIMLVRADPQTETITMLSFPRDLVVEIRCPGGISYRGRINAAYAECGSKGTLETVKGLTALPINYLITVDFRGFTQIVDRLGGVWIDVDRRYFNDNRGVAPGFTYATINLFPGYQKLSGSQALDYVRYRHTDSDLYRIARQQAFVKGFKEAVASSFAPTSLPKIIGTITRNVEVGVGGGGELSGKTVLSYGLLVYGLPTGHFFQSKIEGLTGYDELTTDPSNIQAAVQEFVNPDVAAPAKAAAVALGRKAKLPTGPPPADVSVTVLNGNGVTGSASNAAYLLGQRGYRIVFPPNGAPANAPSFDYFHTKIYFDPGQAGAQAAAKWVANLFGPADVETIPAEIAPLQNGAMLVVTVGQTFHGTLAPSPIDRTPKKQPPAVVSNPSATLPLLTRVKRRVPFRLEVPTVLEKTSSPDREMPIRVYKVGDHSAVRLTFRTGANEYWGIQQTDWEDAPVLAGRNFRHRLGGRTFDLYYSGPRLHMVVRRENGATYWVVNTIVDSLSNETMLAIAKGLRPLKK